MKTWIRRTLLGALGTTLLLGGLAACGHAERHSSANPEQRAEWREKMLDRAARRLDLNEDQKKKLAVVATRLEEQRAALRGATDPRADVQGLVAGAKFDRVRAQTLVTEKTAAVTGKSPELIAAFGDFYDSLNPQQQSEVREFLNKRRGGWRRG